MSQLNLIKSTYRWDSNLNFSPNRCFMIDLIFYYIAEDSYLRLFVLALVPILVAPLAIIYVIRYLFYWFNPKAKMTPTRFFVFAALTTLISLGLMALTLYLYLPANTDFRVPMLFIIVVFGMLGAGRLYLFDPRD